MCSQTVQGISRLPGSMCAAVETMGSCRASLAGRRPCGTSAFFHSVRWSLDHQRSPGHPAGDRVVDMSDVSSESRWRMGNPRCHSQAENQRGYWSVAAESGAFEETPAPTECYSSLKSFWTEPLPAGMSSISVDFALYCSGNNSLFMYIPGMSAPS